MTGAVRVGVIGLSYVVVYLSVLVVCFLYSNVMRYFLYCLRAREWGFLREFTKERRLGWAGGGTAAGTQGFVVL